MSKFGKFCGFMCLLLLTTRAFAVNIPLQNVTDGKSTTTVDMPISQVMKGAINVHKSTSDLKTYVACGDLK